MYSRFQTLPDLVIRHVVGYMLADNRVYQSQSRSEHRPMEAIKTNILSLSHSWRKAMLSHILRSIKIGIGLDNDKTQVVNVSCPDWPYSAESLDPDMFAYYSRHVDIAVDFRMVLNQTKPSLLSQYRMYAQCLKNVRSLKINTFVLNDKTEDNAQKLQNLNSFVVCLQKMMPNLKKVAMDLDVCFDPHNKNIKILLGHYIAQLLGMSNHVKYFSNYEHADIPIIFGTNIELASLEFTWGSNFGYFAKAVRQSRETLQELVIKTVHAKQLVGLFYANDTNKALVYPHLKTFVLKSTYYDKVDSLYGCVLELPPFPSLENIEIKSMYPFADDTIFQNNSATLKSLKMLIDSRVDEMIHNSQGFASGKFKALTNVELYQDLTLNARDIISLDKLVPFINKAKTHITRLSIFDLSYPGFDLEISLAPHILLCQNLHYLSMPSSTIGLSCLLDFIIGIPALTKINCQLANMDPLFEVIPESKLPNHIYKHYFQNIDNRCIEWQVETNPYVSYKRVAKVIILLKVAIPTFLYSVPDTRSAERYLVGLRECTSIAHFAEYASKVLARLE